MVYLRVIKFYRDKLDGKARFGKWDNGRFFLSEYKTLELGDKRLCQRAIGIFKALQSRLTTCVRRLFHDARDMRQAYDFFSNPKVSKKALMEPHIQNTAKRIKSTSSNYILAIQDTMLLNYSTHKAKTEIGRISRTGKIDQYGLMQHSTLCVTDKNECLGLIDMQYFHNDEFDKSIDSDRRAIEDKKTNCWLIALRNMRKRIGECTKEIITVADREGDFFEFLHELTKENESFVIRAQHNRTTGKRYQTGEKIFDLLRDQTDLGEITVSINDVETHEVKEICLKIKMLKEVTLPVPRWTEGNSKDKEYRPIKVNVVKAYNEEHCWVILTNLCVDDLKACQKVITIYRERWHIEDYHKVLKTGYQVDELYLHSSRQAMENALVMASISACRLYWIIYVGRVEETIKANELFKDYEWKCLYVYFKEALPAEIPKLSEVIIKIARLGGYKIQKKFKPPGIKTMWIGFQGFTIAAEMYLNVMSTKT